VVLEIFVGRNGVVRAVVCFVGVRQFVGNEITGSCPEQNFGGFWSKKGGFSYFSMKSAVAGRVLRSVASVVSAGDSIGSCDSKTAGNGALLCLTAGGCGELALLREAEFLKTL
jgi:hypothetical protein